MIGYFLIPKVDGTVTTYDENATVVQVVCSMTYGMTLLKSLFLLAAATFSCSSLDKAATQAAKLPRVLPPTAGLEPVVLTEGPVRAALSLGEMRYDMPDLHHIEGDLEEVDDLVQKTVCVISVQLCGHPLLEDCDALRRVLISWGAAQLSLKPVNTSFKEITTTRKRRGYTWERARDWAGQPKHDKVAIWTATR